MPSLQGFVTEEFPMDARTGVEQQPRPFLARESVVKGKRSTERPTAEPPAVAVAESTIPWTSPAIRGKDASGPLSPDPMRATDRYRLVMPWSARV